MTNEEFMIVVNVAFAKSKAILEEKETEYSFASGNRLGQFTLASKMLGTTPIEVAVTLAAKHFTSIVGMAKSPSLYNPEKWREKLADLRNYTFIIDALLIEEGVE